MPLYPRTLLEAGMPEGWSTDCNPTRIAHFQSCTPSTSRSSASSSSLDRLLLKTYEYRSTAAAPRASVVLVHGVDGHTHAEWTSPPRGKFEGSWIEQLTREGFNVFAFDHQGPR